ncbi:MAG TPA: carbamoyltransferase C-terminal domain-containing protein [Thermomicrobiales bacterium]|nr:carbamoyltransferase C-terminal domain-containing protein [Thermomicrobiales bacterium]
MTRRKGDGREHPDLAIDEALSIAGATRRDVDVVCCSRAEFATVFYRNIRGVRWLREQYRKHVEKNTRRYMPPEFRRYNTARIEDIFDVAKFRRAGGFRDDAEIFFYNHHESHALAPLFYTEWSDALLVTADGGGDTVNYSHRHFADGALTTIYGGEECLLLPLPTDSLGHAYETVTAALGFIPRRHEGKLTGLAAFGRPILAEKFAARFFVDDAGRVQSDFRDFDELHGFIRRLVDGVSREDAAASIQRVLEDTMLRSIARLLQRHKARHLGLAGGVFANVRLNRVLAERLPIDEIFIFPAMGDEGMPAGGALCYLLQRDGLPRWLAQRRRLRDVYLGRDYTGGIDATLKASAGIRCTGEPPVAGAARRLQAGQLGAIHTGRMEYGPRALGARSILANPSRRETHDLLNARLERSEFMPFAPVIAAEKAATVFDVKPVNAYACRFMTITCDVKPQWRERIAAVVHVDGSARPQTIERDTNPLYYDILAAFERESGLPVLVNTSFNVHEEPIVNTPAESVGALLDGRIDFLVTTRGIYVRAAGVGAANT